MNKLRRSIVVLASAMAIASGALILTAHAADQASAPTGAQPAGVARSTPVPPTSNTVAANPATRSQQHRPPNPPSPAPHRSRKNPQPFVTIPPSRPIRSSPPTTA